MANITIQEEFFDGLIWNNGKPYSEAQAYIQFMVWAAKMGNQTHFVNGTMLTLKPNEFMMSQRKIADSLNWTQSAVSRFLKKLISLNQCRLNNDSKLTRILLVVKEPVADSKLNQVANQPTDLFSTSFGVGGTNSDISNNYNIINNNNTDNNNNTNTNNNIYNKSPKNLDTGKTDIGVSRVSKSVKPKYIDKPKDLDMVKEYFNEKYSEYKDQAEPFYEWFESVGWKRGKTPIKKWRMAVGQWVRTEKEKRKNSFQGQGQGSWSPKPKEKFKKTDKGFYMAYCKNVNSDHYGTTFFIRQKWKLEQSCEKCGHDLVPDKPTNVPTKQIHRETSNDKEELISFAEFQTREKESPEGSRTTERGGQLLSEILGPMLQQGQGRS